MPRFRAVEGGPLYDGRLGRRKRRQRLRMGRGPNTATVPHPIERQTLCASSLGLVESSLTRLATGTQFGDPGRQACGFLWI